jgi:phosphatidylinositol-3-phosphatase
MDMSRSFLRPALLGALFWFAPALLALAGAFAADAGRFDHVYVIVLENHDFDDAFDEQRTPFLSRLAREQALATQYYGVTHPSLPNYLAMISGDSYGVSDDAPSCFASDLKTAQSCHHVEGDSLVDALEAAGLTFSAYFDSAPSVGALEQAFPDAGANALYAQKHNPFVYFDQIATNPARLAKLKTLDDLDPDLAGTAANFVFIAPNQCHDGHGLPVCRDEAQLQRAYDSFVASTVGSIRRSPNWTQNSAIVITFDEGEFSHKTAHAAETENRIPTIVVTQCGGPATSDAHLDHYALLATIEDGFGLPRLRKSSSAPTLANLFRRPCQTPTAAK